MGQTLWVDTARALDVPFGSLRPTVANGVKVLREDYKVEPFADVRAKAGLSSTFLKTPSVGQAGNRTKAFHSTVRYIYPTN